MAFDPTVHRFDGINAIVTGAASGIGLAIAEGLLDRGARVLAVDLGDPPDELARRDDCVAFARGDVTSGEAHQRFVQECNETFGEVDLLVNNAGITLPGSVHELDESSWHKVVSVDLDAVYLGAKAVLPSMMAQGGGRIVNTASTLGFLAQHQLAAYTAAKHGVIGLTRQLAVDYGRFGIRTNCVCPGPTLTPNIERSYGGSDKLAKRGKYLLDSIPLERMGHPHEIAAAVFFLASDAASFVNGAALVVDGGHSVHTGPLWTADLY